LAGWGQFIDATSPVFQIGPYGTAAGVLVSQVAFPTQAIDPRVKARLQKFWDEKPNGKMYPQNVRLAFTALALAKASDTALVTLRQEITGELIKRQQDDGSWDDAVAHAASSAGGQPDATAWVILALRRCGGYEPAVEKGARWLAERCGPSGATSLLPIVGIAAAIACRKDFRSVPGLHARGLEILSNTAVNREELISFYDYEERKGSEQVQSRDYLCFPAFYPLAVLIMGLGAKAKFWENIRLTTLRSDAIRKLSELSDGHPYKSNPTARFSSTVDQAMYALAYEEMIAAEEASWSGTRLLSPVYNFIRTNTFVQLTWYFWLPALGCLLFAVLLAFPALDTKFVAHFAGKSATPLVAFVTKHEDRIQLIASFFVTLIFAVPAKGWTLFRRMLWKRKG
jgi:hypothetical protein